MKDSIKDAMQNRGLARRAAGALLWMAAASPACAEEAPAQAAAPAAPVAAPAVADTPAIPGHLKVRLGSVSGIVNGDAAQFRQRHGVDDNFVGGLEEFLYTTELGEDTDLRIDGRAIANNHDYLLGVRIENEEKGWFSTGYKQFRTWYDGRGGFYPPASASFQPFDPQLGLDRGEAWANGGLLLPNDFKLTMGYRYLLRNGTKSSVIWGDSAALGLAPPNNRRSIVPAFQQIDEDRHLVDVSLSRATETSEAGTAFRYENTNLDNRRSTVRTPGEASDRWVTERDGSKSNVFASRVFGSRRFLDDKLHLSAAYAYNDLDLDLAGSRIYGATINPSFDPNFARRQQRDEGFLGLGGTTTMREHVGNLSMLATPFEDVQVLSAMRVRGEQRHANSDTTITNVGASPTFTTAFEEVQGISDTDETSFAEDLEVRYKGIRNVTLYTRAQWEQNSGDINERELEPELALTAIARITDIDRQRQNYAIGAKAYPWRWWHMSAEYSYRVSDYDYRNAVDSTSNDPVGPPPSGDRYPAYMLSQTLRTHDFSLRSTFRLPGDVGLVARYDWLQTTINSHQDQLEEIQAAQSRAHMFSGTLSWNPTTWWWTQAGFNYMLSTTDVAANNYATPVAGFFPSFDNDYVLLRATSGAALDDLTDLEMTGHWMSAKNGQDLWASTVAYGSDFEEHGIGLRATRKVGENAKVSAGYGYFVNDESFAGGNYDYDAHILTTSVEFQY